MYGFSFAYHDLFVHGTALEEDFDIGIAFGEDVEIQETSSGDVKLNFLGGIVEIDLGVEGANGGETAVGGVVHFGYCELRQLIV